MRRLIYLGLMLSILASFSVEANTEMFVSCESDTNHIEIGEEMDVTVFVNPDREIDTVAIDLMTWNQNVIELIGFERGDLFENTLVWIEGDVSDGELKGMCWGCDVQTSEQGEYVTFTFKGISNGETAISLDQVGIARAGTDVPIDKTECSIIVGSGINVDPAGSSEPLQLPIFLIAVIIIISAFVLYVYKGRKGT